MAPFQNRLKSPSPGWGVFTSRHYCLVAFCFAQLKAGPFLIVPCTWLWVVHIELLPGPKMRFWEKSDLATERSHLAKAIQCLGAVSCGNGHRELVAVRFCWVVGSKCFTE